MFKVAQKSIPNDSPATGFMVMTNSDVDGGGAASDLSAGCVALEVRP
jgi:hypothetical protein